MQNRAMVCSVLRVLPERQVLEKGNVGRENGEGSIRHVWGNMEGDMF